jgi:cytochrome c
MIRHYATGLAILILCAGATSQTVAAGNSAQGQRIFGACAACHSLQPDQNMTGPSLADLWGRKAGSLSSFNRYSSALKSASVTWDDQTLNEWIKDPQHLVPGNEMTFAGIKDDRQRADLLAFLKQATQPGASVAQQGGSMGGMGGGGMMGGGRVPNLKHLDPENRVQEISYCKDTYTVTTADGQTRKFWERNLRLKTDASADGPEKNAPALVRAGMTGDRADVIFADPTEISAHIAAKC